MEPQKQPRNQGSSSVVLDKENEDVQNRNTTKLTKYISEAPSVVVASFCLGLLCLLVSMGYTVFTSVKYMPAGGEALVFLIIMPMLEVSLVGVILSITAFRKIRKNFRGNTIYGRLLVMTSFGLIGSLSFFVAIPISWQMQSNLEKDFQKRQVAQELAEEAEQIRYETTPDVIIQLQYYDLCYAYQEGSNYRAGRDAICSYLRYMYSNDWQKPQDGEQLSHQKYTPKYFSGLNDSSIKISEDSSDIHRAALWREPYYLGYYLITPQLSCQKENNNSLISVWYLDRDNVYDDGDEKFVCMYYDYHSDTQHARLNKYGNSSFSIYSPEFKDFYEELLRMLYRRSLNNSEYIFTVPYRDIATNSYNNADFMKDFFSEITIDLTSQ